MKKKALCLSLALLIICSLALTAFADSPDVSPNTPRSPAQKPYASSPEKELDSGGIIPKTVEEKVNELTLNPIDKKEIKDEWGMALYNKYTNLVTPEMSNYEILRVVYDDVVQNYRTETLKGTNMPGAFQCTAYAHALCKGLKIVGFDVRYITGECAAVGGGWTAHAWSAIKVGNEILYLDANIPGEHGGNADIYFARVPSNTTVYRNAVVKMYEVSPDLRTFSVLEIKGSK